MSAEVMVTPDLRPDATVVAAPQQVSALLGDEVVILQVDDGVYYGLGAVGRTVWDLLRQPRSVREMRDLLLDEYEVEPARCEHDLLALLHELAARRLIEIRGYDPRGGEPGERAPP